MLLNIDCVRDILSEIAKQPMDTFIHDMPDRLSKYKIDDVNYALSILNEEECIHCDVYYGNNKPMYSVGTMTKKGLDLYSKIQSDTAWNKIKNKLKQFGESISISLLSTVATDVFNLISNQ